MASSQCKSYLVHLIGFVNDVTNFHHHNPMITWSLLRRNPTAVIWHSITMFVVELNPDFSGCYINRRLRCDTEIEQPYYSKEYGPLLCIQCAKPLDAEGIRIILLKVSLGSLYVMTKELCTKYKPKQNYSDCQVQADS